MRILLDECLPVDFRHELASAGVVETAKYARLDHLSNGALLAAMAGRFDVLITVDTSLRYQNAIIGQPVAVVVLRAPTNAIVDLRPLVPSIVACLAKVQPGMVAEVQ
jgi:predicted nuclease of predicted toxin-antitoxin system